MEVECVCVCVCVWGGGGVRRKHQSATFLLDLERVGWGGCLRGVPWT